MKKYEYKKIHALDLMVNRAIVIEKLNALGEQGWEMVAIINWNGKPAFIYFKRVKSQTCIRCHGRGTAKAAGGGVISCGVCNGKGEIS